MTSEMPIEPVTPVVPDEAPEAVPEPVLEPVPTASAEAAQLLTYFKAIDPRREGVGLEKIRPFYGVVGWSVILKPARELIALGMLRKRPVMNAKGGVGYELYTWVEA